MTGIKFDDLHVDRLFLYAYLTKTGVSRVCDCSSGIAQD